MKWLLILIVFVAHSAFAQKEHWLHSAGFAVTTVSSDVELKNLDQEKALTFRPNVASGSGLAIETKYIGLAYLFTGNESQFKEFPKSKYQDIRFNFHLRHFDFRLNYQHYRGAVVKEGGLSKFYKDYEVKSLNGRIHYYGNSEHLNFVRDGKKLIERVASNEGFNHSRSWFAGLNLDRRRLTLPENLAPEHQAELTEEDIEYSRFFQAFSWGPMLGYDFLLQLSSLYFRAKLGAGPAFQSSGEVVEQFEFAFNWGGAFKKRHLLSLGFDMYVMSFEDDLQIISNNNAQIAITYTYAF